MKIVQIVKEKDHVILCFEHHFHSYVISGERSAN